MVVPPQIALTPTSQVFTLYSEKMMSTSSEMHPTKRLLIEHTISMMETKLSHQINAEAVLQRSLVSKGSLYHHFEDFSHLMEVAQIEIFRRNTNVDLKNIISGMNIDSNPLDIFRQLMDSITSKRLSLSNFEQQERLIIIADAQLSPRLKAHLLQVEDEIILTWMEFFRKCLDLGWADPHLNDRSIGTMVEVLIHGRVIGDISLESVDTYRWIMLIQRFIEETYFRLAKVA